MGIYRCLSGFQNLYDGQLSFAKKDFETSIRLAHLNGHTVWEARSGIGLALLASNEGNERTSRDYVAEAERCASEVDFGSDFLILSVLKVKHQLQNGEAVSNEIFSKFKDCPVYESLLSRVLKKQGKEKRLVRSGGEEHAFVLKLFGFIFPRTTPVVRLVSMGTASDINQEEVKKATSGFDVFLDRFTGKLMVRGKVHSSTPHEGGLNLLRLFMDAYPTVLDKEQITAHFWKEAYNPLVHDSRIYTAVKRLRVLLKDAGIEGFLQTQDGGYVLSSKLKFGFVDKRPESSLNPSATMDYRLREPERISR